MAFVPAPNTVELQFRQTFALQQTMNRIHIGTLTAPTESICQAIATAGAVWWTNNVDSIVSNQLALREVYVKSLAEENGPQASFSSGLPAPGLLTAGALPNNVSIAASLRTGLTGRSARGRWFWQGLTELQVTGNVVEPGALSDIDAALTNLRSAIVALGYLWIIISYISGGGPRPGGPVYFVVNDILFTDSIVDSQRGRLPGRGN